MDKWYYVGNQESEEIAVNEYDITSVPNDFNMSTIFSLIESGIVKIPDFQRNYVWDQKRASKLIESIILGLPVPQVFFYERERNSYLVIDGQQRLMTIYFFMKQRFPKPSIRNILRSEFEQYGKIQDSFLSNDDYFTNFILRLNNNERKSIYNGKKFSTLDDKIKNQFEHMRTMRSIVIRQNAPDDSDSSMFEIFNRLNTGGQNLTAQEIRASLFYSPFYDMLYDLNTNKKWRNILKKDSLDIHSKDVEFIIRSFMLLVDYKDYRPSMTRSLNRFSKTAKNYNDDIIKYYKDLFVSFLDACDTLENGAFCIKNRFNISRFDATFVAICKPFFETQKLVDGNIDAKSFEDLINEKDFSDCTQSSTASANSVKGRIEIAESILKLQ